jgi:hypothetical protein
VVSCDVYLVGSSPNDFLGFVMVLVAELVNHHQEEKGPRPRRPRVSLYG